MIRIFGEFNYECARFCFKSAARARCRKLARAISGPHGYIVPQTGEWGRHSGSVNPNHLGHHVSLGLGLQLTHKERIQYVYLHECAHLVLCAAVKKAGQTMDAHGPCFLLTLMALVSRVDSAGLSKRPIFRTIDFYDYQDCPPFLQRLQEHEWRPLLLSFAFKHYKRLAESEMSAEALGEEARRLWMKEDGLVLYEMDREVKELQKTTREAQAALYEARQQLREKAQDGSVSASMFFGSIAAFSLLSATAAAYIAPLFA